MTGRSDDTEDSIKVRFEVYKKDTVEDLHMEEVIHELYQQTLMQDV